MEKIIQNQNEIDMRLYKFPNSIIRLNNVKINYLHFLSNTSNEDCLNSLEKFVNIINLEKIYKFVDKVELMTDTHKSFTKKMLSERYNKILCRSFEINKNKKIVKGINMSKKEEYYSKKRALELWDKNLIDEFDVGTFNGLKQIHKYIFQDVYDFAGKIRTVNLSKGNFRFAPLLFLESNLKIIEDMPESSFDNIIDKYVEMNVAHPFREGNGRATRIWLDLILRKNLEICIDWSKIDKNDYLSAMERSVVNTLEIKYLLKNALTKDIYDREVYMKGIEKSYEYENQYEYSIYDIDKEIKKNGNKSR